MDFLSLAIPPIEVIMGKALLRFGPVLGVLLLFTNSAWAVDDAVVKAKIKAAISYLSSQSYSMVEDGPRGPTVIEEGPAALAGIALMEAGVDPGDPVIKNIATIVREKA